MGQVVEIGEAPWSREQMRAALDEFETVYDRRPIRDNRGGMKAPHMFALWFMARSISPGLVVESGVWKGQGTWLLEQACPDARIISMDPRLSVREFRSDRVEYTDSDFSELDWSDILSDESLVVFDDHQNAYARLQQCWWTGFQHVIFEDNYPSSQGDCYSLKRALSGAGFRPESRRGRSANRGVADRLRQALGGAWREMRNRGPNGPGPQEVPANRHDAIHLRRNLEVYREFPPVHRPAMTRWGDPWSEEKYPTPAPLLDDREIDQHPVFRDEALDYTWICYARLKASREGARVGAER